MTSPAPNIDINALMDTIVSRVMALGVFSVVNKHEAIGNIGTYVASLWLNKIDPVRVSGLAMTSVRIEFTLRIYSNAVTQPTDEIDPQMASATVQVVNTLTTGFTLGNAAREIDLLGQVGTPLSGKAGYLNLSGALYRVMDICIPVLVDDVFQQVA